MPLTDDLRPLLYEAMREGFDEKSLERVLYLRVGKRLDELVSSREDFQYTVTQVIQVAERYNWVPKLVQALSAENPENEKVKALSTRLAAVADWAGTDPYRRCALRGGRLFINRADLRLALQELATPAPDNRRVLVVDGTPGTGRSYSAQYIYHLAEVEPHGVAQIDLAKEHRMAPDVVAYELVAQVDGGQPETIPARGTLSQAAWVRRLAWWVVRQIHNNGRMHWLVFDSFSKADLDPDTLELVHELAVRAVQPQPNARELRIVLLSYSSSDLLPPEVDEVAAREWVAELTPADFVACAQAVLAEQSAPPADGALLLADVEALFAAHPVGSDQRLRKLAAGLRRVIHNHSSPKPGG
jgi:hypothetical protein